MEHGWKLTNLTGGGDGCPNPAPEVRKAMSDKKIGNSNAKGHTVSEELRKASSLRNKTRIITEETRKKKSVSMMGNKRAVGNRSTTGRIRTEEHKEHIRLSLVNKPPMTPEALERFKLAMIGHKVTDEGRANMSKGQLGNQNSLGTHRTDEQKENIGEGIKKAWDRRKESGPILISEETRQKLKDAQKRRRDREKKGKE